MRSREEKLRDHVKDSSKNLTYRHIKNLFFLLVHSVLSNDVSELRCVNMKQEVICVHRNTWLSTENRSHGYQHSKQLFILQSVEGITFSQLEFSSRYTLYHNNIMFEIEFYEIHHACTCVPKKNNRSHKHPLVITHSRQATGTSVTI